VGGTGENLRCVLMDGQPGNGQAELVRHIARTTGAHVETWDVRVWENDREGALESLEALRGRLNRCSGSALLEVRNAGSCRLVAPGFPAYLAGWLEGLGRRVVVFVYPGDKRLHHALSEFLRGRGSLAVEVGPPSAREISALIAERKIWPGEGEPARLADALSGFSRDEVKSLLGAVATAPGAWEDMLAGRGVAVMTGGVFADGAACPLCSLPVADGDAVTCPECGTVHHRKCWEDSGGCTTYGCGAVG